MLYVIMMIGFLAYTRTRVIAIEVKELHTINITNTIRVTQTSLLKKVLKVDFPYSVGG